MGCLGWRKESAFRPASSSCLPCLPRLGFLRCIWMEEWMDGWVPRRKSEDDALSLPGRISFSPQKVDGEEGRDGRGEPHCCSWQAGSDTPPSLHPSPGIEDEYHEARTCRTSRIQIPDLSWSSGRSSDQLRRQHRSEESLHHVRHWIPRTSEPSPQGWSVPIFLLFSFCVWDDPSFCDLSLYSSIHSLIHSFVRECIIAYIRPNSAGEHQVSETW